MQMDVTAFILKNASKKINLLKSPKKILIVI